MAVGYLSDPEMMIGAKKIILNDSLTRWLRTTRYLVVQYQIRSPSQFSPPEKNIFFVANFWDHN